MKVNGVLRGYDKWKGCGEIQQLNMVSEGKNISLVSEET